MERVSLGKGFSRVAIPQMRLICSALALALTLALSKAGLAADLSGPATSSVLEPPRLSWMGLYVGGNVGALFGGSSSVSTSAWNLWPGNANIDYASAALVSGQIPGGNTTRFIGGGQIGFNVALPAGLPLVAGLEADFQGLAGTAGNGNVWREGIGSDDVGPSHIMSNQQASGRLDYLGTVRGRLGYLLFPSFLIYGTGGLAYGKHYSSLQNTQIWTDYLGPWNAVYGQSASYGMLVGWTAGGGGEWRISENWSLKTEYLYFDLGGATGSVINKSEGLVEGIFSGLQSKSDYSSRANGHVVRMGLNFHFSGD